jgi:hypothetical protein
MRFIQTAVLAVTFCVGQTGIANSADDLVAPDPGGFDWSGLYTGAEASASKPPTSTSRTRFTSTRSCRASTSRLTPT